VVSFVGFITLPSTGKFPASAFTAQQMLISTLKVQRFPSLLNFKASSRHIRLRAYIIKLK
jgi:hypothetical protein